MTDAILSAVGDLSRPDGPFAAALTAPGPAQDAIARALETIDGAAAGTADAPGATRRLEALFHARLAAGVADGDVPAHLDVDALATFFTSVAASLAAAAQADRDPGAASAIRRVALTVLSPHRPTR